ncbi:Amidophosphoribosyltransferase [Castellaniella defragrans]
MLLVDDSIVRGTTSREIVEMARAAGAKKVFFASAAPAVRYPNVYGIDMPTQAELIATGRDTEQVAWEIGADGLVYQDLNDLEQSLRDLNPALKAFESSCFNGRYITGDIDEAYLERLSRSRLEPVHSGAMAAPVEEAWSDAGLARPRPQSRPDRAASAQIDSRPHSTNRISPQRLYSTPSRLTRASMQLA